MSQASNVVVLRAWPGSSKSWGVLGRPSGAEVKRWIDLPYGVFKRDVAQRADPFWGLIEPQGPLVRWKAALDLYGAPIGEIEVLADTEENALAIVECAIACNRDPETLEPLLSGPDADLHRGIEIESIERCEP